MATGDIAGNIANLARVLKHVKYTGAIDEVGQVAPMSFLAGAVTVAGTFSVLCQQAKMCDEHAAWWELQSRPCAT